MLKSISCDAFMDHGKKRDPITFHYGLNSVVGYTLDSNSIGKSTLLMIIDFCFGGNDYTDKEKDTIQKVGPHTINFEYEFDGISHCFARSTDSPAYVMECDKNYNQIGRIPVELFRQELSKWYGLDVPGLTFRAAISRFFRIYNRGTHNELRPLNATVREDDKSGIISMLRLYGLFGEVEHLEQEDEDALAKKMAFDKARELNLAPIAKDEKERESNKATADKLEKELSTIKHDNKTGTGDPDFMEANAKAALLDERKKLRFEQSMLDSQINDIQFEDECDVKSFARNLEKLKEFFPEANFQEIEDIDAFHKNVKSILNQETKASNEAISQNIAIISRRADEIDKALAEYKSTPDVPQATLDRYSDVKARIDYLTKANQNYVMKKEVDKQYSTTHEKLMKAVMTQTTKMSSEINKRMGEMNAQMGNGSKFAPELTINGLQSYSFVVPSDTGTGNRFKGIVMFDLAVIEQTKIPAICHDSIVFNNISGGTLAQIFAMYMKETSKQIFISYDIEHEPSSAPRKILEDTKVISLYPDKGSLFGRALNKQ